MRKIKRTTIAKIAFGGVSLGLNAVLFHRVFRQSKRIIELEKENQVIRDFSKGLKKNNDNLNYHLGKAASKLENK